MLKMQVSNETSAVQFNHILMAAFFFFSIFPNVSPVPLPSDTQPISFIISLVFIVLYNRYIKIPNPIAMLAVLALFSIVLSFNEPFNFSSARSVFNYLNIFVGTLVAYFLVKQKNYDFQKVLDFSLVLYTTAAALQILVSRDIFGGIVPVVRTDETRGVTSLATEPALFSCYSMIIYGLSLLSKKILTWRLLFALVNLLVFSKSGIGFLIFLAFISTTAIFTARKDFLIFACLSGMLLFPITLNSLENNNSARFLYLANVALDNPELLFQDTSVSERTAHTFLAFKSVFDNYGLPNGYSEWHDYFDNNIYEWSWLFPYGGSGERILSGYGTLLYELGIIGIIIPILLVYASWQAFRNKPFMYFAGFNAIIHTILLINMPPGSPAIALTLGVLLAHNTQNSVNS